jgi:hypothetical protein
LAFGFLLLELSPHFSETYYRVLAVNATMLSDGLGLMLLEVVDVWVYGILKVE